MTATTSPAVILLRGVGLEPKGPLAWGTSPPATGPGVYIVETPEALAGAPVDAQLVQAWLDRVPTLSVDGSRPTVEQLADRLGRFWIPRQRIVYIGVASKRLDQRLRAYYRTRLGDRSPHAGGHWIRTLAHLDSFHVWWSLAADPAAAEDALLTAFARSVPARSRARIPGGDVIILPFANKENATKTLRKPHGIRTSTLSRPRDNPGQIAPGSSTERDIDERPTRQGGASLADINAALQEMACADPGGRVPAVAAAAELERRGLLRDSPTRRGKPLRDLLRADLIDHAEQERNTRWSISCAEPPR